MSAQPSPGSWVAWRKHKNGVRDRLGRYAVLRDSPGAREVIADNLRTQAYADLVAAAPDLLAALRDLLRYHESGGRKGDFDTVEATARAAIAKATQP